jgi:pimeloyl-ACP methyl ester carboxylesterase
MPHLEVAGRRLHYLRRGSGEPLLLIQGMSGTHIAWGEPFLSELERDFDVIVYDHRGIGYSDAVDEPFTLAELASDAAALLTALDIDTTHVMGISMGGMVAQELALDHPQRVRTLTLGCTYCGGPNARLTAEEVVARLGEAMMSGDRERIVRVGWEVNLSQRFRADAGRFDAFRAMALGVPAPLPVIMLQMRAIAGHDTSARLPSISAPTLVVHGTEDQMLDAANGILIASLIPGARLELIEGAGHLFWWEEPERSAALVREHALAAQRSSA